LETLSNSNYLGIIPRVGAIWRQMANRYKHLDPDSTIFEIINEPSFALSNQQYVEFMQAMVDTIREQTIEHTIIVSCPFGGSPIGFNFFEPLIDTNLIYTFHFYSPLYFTHQGASWTPIAYPIGEPFPDGGNDVGTINTYNIAVDWANQHNKPMYNGEFGVINYADDVSRCNWIRMVGDLNYQNDIPWAYWNWDSPAGTNFGFFTNDTPSVETLIPCFGEALRIYGMEPTGLDERIVSEIVMVEYFPNPTDERVNINVLNDINEPMTIELFNIFGERQKSIQFNQSNFSLDIHDLPSGVYILHISSMNYILSSHKIVIE